jgi:HPt (histidine-containing phosphotransfer) domain-containing protein
LLAHTLKGTAGGFGMPGLTTLAGQIETAVKAGSYADAAALCQTLRHDAEEALGTTT